MKTETLTKSIRAVRLENTLVKLGFFAVLSVNAFLGFNIATRDEAVILVPPWQNAEIEFINGRANRDYYEQWAWSTAMLAGNLTPANADFVRGELGRMATAPLFRSMAETLDVDLANIVRDSAVITFAPREVIYDAELDLFFVVGRQSIGGPGVRNPIDKQMVYELGFTTQRLRIYLDHYAAYEGKPLTSDIRDAQLAERAAEAKAAKAGEAGQ